MRYDEVEKGLGGCLALFVHCLAYQYSVLVYIGARIAQLLDHMDDSRWHSSVLKYVEMWQIAVGLVLLALTMAYLVKWIKSSNS
jgi:hypothetical protein